MYLISNNCNSKHGPIIRVLVLPLTQDSLSGKLIPATDPGLNPELKEYNALIDTGADISLISNKVLNEMSPTPHFSGLNLVTGITEANKPAPVLAVAIAFPLDVTPPPYKIENVQATLFDGFKKSDGFVIDLLIGRDILFRGLLSVSSDRFSLQFPPHKDIDKSG